VEFLQLALTGLAVSASYAMLSQSIVVVYRGTGVPNFAAGAFGMFGGYVFYDLWPGTGVPWPIALIVSLLCCAAIGVAMHLVVMRRLRTASTATKVIATLGLMTLLTALADQYFAPYGAVRAVPTFLGSGLLHLSGQLSVSSEQLWLVALSVLLTAGLVVLQRRTRFGLATSAVCENEAVAAGMGWSPDLIAAANWAIGGAISGLAIILLAPIAGMSPTDLTLLVVPALCAALIGRFDSVVLALVGAFVLGIGESEVGLVTSASGWSEAAPLILLIILLLVRGEGRGDRSEVPQRLASAGSGRVGIAAGVCAVVAAVALMVLPVGWLGAVTATLLLSIGLLSMVVLTGYAGQLSLAQYGLAGVSAYAVALLSARFGVPIWLAIVLAVVVTVCLGMIVAAPALRSRGVTLAIATLSLVVVIEDLLLTSPTAAAWLGYNTIPPLTIFGLSLNPLLHPRSFGLFILVVFVLASLVVTNLRRGAMGRRLLAIRANPQAAASIGISPTSAKMYAFAVAGGLAAVCGALTEAQLSYPDFSLFSTSSSITLVLQATLGGIGWIAGALTGGLAAAGGVGDKALGLVISPSNWLDVITAGIFLLVIVQSPDGAVPLQVQQMRWLAARWKGSIARDRSVGGAGSEGAARLSQWAPRSSSSSADAFTRSVKLGRILTGRKEPVALEVDDLTVIFGRVRAVDGVSLSVQPGEVVGLIGPNGAGKSTFIDAVCGYIQPAAGHVALGGREIGRLRPARRAKLGLVRAFQHLELFEDMTVGENLLTASERPRWWRGVADLVWPGAAITTEAARLAADAFGLWEFASRTPRTLDHGRRRLLGVARAFAADPAIVLLDEPAAGLDARERGEFAGLLRKVATEWKIGILLVEHDVNLVFGVCDRVVALVNGAVVAEGVPEQVRRNDAVRTAYLGRATELHPDQAELHPDHAGLRADQVVD
jgi:ABC-type branched-subunit amino acid transport system ATPase component/branched-subunit amino acid ABC-type transport system permease component